MEMNSPQMARATIIGDSNYPDIRGVVFLDDVDTGTMVYVDIEGLPPYQPETEDQGPIGPFGFHIHEFGQCIPTDDEAFEEAGGHWNPTNQPHGNHAGDFPVLFSNDGRAYMIFYTNKFRVEDAIGKSIIIHENPDDYRTQPTGDSGKRIACGVIKPYLAEIPYQYYR